MSVISDFAGMFDASFSLERTYVLTGIQNNLKTNSQGTLSW